MFAQSTLIGDWESVNLARCIHQLAHVTQMAARRVHILVRRTQMIDRRSHIADWVRQIVARVVHHFATIISIPA
jgi:hypothetical protein